MEFKTKTRLTIAATVTCLLCMACDTNASIIFTNTQVNESGTGFGNRLTVLSVQQKGNNTTESGSILWNGAADVDAGDATNQSETQTVADLLAEGINENTLTVIFNINEGGEPAPVLTLHDFSLVFLNAAGAEQFRETYSAPVGGLDLDQAGSGNGASGWRFDVAFDNPAAAASFFSVPTNRLGMEIASGQAIEDTSGGAESFFVISPVPEPSSGLLCLVGLALACRFPRRRGLNRSDECAGNQFAE